MVFVPVRSFKHGPNVIKLFICNLRILMIRWEAFPAYTYKHSSLVKKLVTYGQKVLLHWLQV
jgi:hypothetical protein